MSAESPGGARVQALLARPGRPPAIDRIPVGAHSVRPDPQGPCAKRISLLYAIISQSRFHLSKKALMSEFEKLDADRQLKIVRHLELVIEANKKTNLTKIDTPEDGMTLHVEDSLSGLKELQDAPDGLYGDMGSGAGYPGIPLAIASGRETVLIDARQKKAQVLAEMIKELGLEDQLSTYSGRVELLARTQSKRYAALTARALAKLPVLMELAGPLLRDGGVLICYKAHLDEDELADARRVQDLVGMKLQSDRSFMLNGKFQRRILTFKREGTPKVKLPRQEGQAQKNPL